MLVLVQPTLSQDAADAIAEEYSRLRSHEMENPDVARTQPVTARALETLIRLSTAHARARLSKVIWLLWEKALYLWLSGNVEI